MVVTDQATLVASCRTKWRVGERQIPESRHQLARDVITSNEAHPLAMTMSFSRIKHINRAVSSRSPRHSTSIAPSSDSIGTKKSENEVLRELVILQDGDVDPLGVLTSSSDGKRTSHESVVMMTKTRSIDVVSTAKGPYKEDKTMPRTVKTKWEEHTDCLLAKYADYTFKIKASMLEVNEVEPELLFDSTSNLYHKEDTIMTVDAASVMKKTRARLEQLERGGREKTRSSVLAQDEETIEISQSQYVAKVKEMQTKLLVNWEQDHKVEALRIAIKCVKLLADIDTAPQLYPCVFVLVSEVLDTFGKLVYDRIRTLASEDENGQPLSQPLGEHFTSSDINVQATETCRNWFYKSACIRELLPRIYVEVALLRCYCFLCDGEYPQIVARLSNMIKGIGEPMVALYARLYLSLTSSELLGTSSPADQTVVVSSSLFDYFYAFHWFRQHRLEDWLHTHKMEYGEYLALHSPAVEWLCKCAAPGATQETFDSLLAHSQAYFDSSMVLKHLCECFGAQFYASTPSLMLELIRTASPSLVSKCHLYSLVAVQLSSVLAVAENESGGKLQFLNSSWSLITAQNEITQYMECAAAYMKLIVAHFSHREALILLKDVVRHLNAAIPEELTAKTYNLLGALIENVVFGAKQHYEFFLRLIPSHPFLTLMDMFKRESSVNVAKKVLRAFVGGDMKKSLNRSGTLRLHVVGPEAAVAHTLLVVCCRVHDALDSLSTVSERAEVNRDISAFITRLGYVNEKDDVSERAQDEEVEALLMLYTDCRRAFYKLESIKILLSTMVLRLAMHVHKRISGSVVSVGSKKRAHVRRNFVQSCLAFAHITIPSIDAPLEKLQLMVAAANVALVTSCIPQMDAMVKAAIIFLADLDLSAVRSSCNSNKESGMMSFFASSHGAAVKLFGVMGINSTSIKIDQVVQVIAQLASVLVYAPSLNDDDAFYYINALRKAVLERMVWTSRTLSSLSYQLEAGVARVRVLLMLVQVYAIWAQRSLPDRLESVDSNDVLYCGDDSFYNEVQARFSSVVEEVARDIELLGQISKDSDSDNVGSAVTDQVMAAQIELMLDVVNLVVPLLEYDETRPEEALVTTNPYWGDEFTDNSRSGSRRRKKSRSGTVLVCKCMMYSHEKVKLLKQAKPRDTSTNQLQMATWICLYFNSTRAYVVNFMLEMSKRTAGIRRDATSQHTVQTLADALNQLVL
ncbi:unnamed protein product [Peronospora belbahrii]|uniref:Uncharacterized protein n=1 Tax=Peronospora belbahrii TaxID=622444 RepID=A0AAU9KP37_9STRA|nr:unnamed protein product [Peronospora belbahrii]